MAHADSTALGSHRNTVALGVVESACHRSIREMQGSKNTLVVSLQHQYVGTVSKRGRRSWLQADNGLWLRAVPERTNFQCMRRGASYAPTDCTSKLNSKHG